MTQTGLFEWPLQGEPFPSPPSVCILAIQKESFVPFPRTRNVSALPSPPRRKEWIYSIRETGRNSWAGEFSPLWTACLWAEWALLSLCFHVVSTGGQACLREVGLEVHLCVPHTGVCHGWGSNSTEVHLPHVPQFSLGEGVLRSRDGGEDHGHKFNPTPPGMRLTFWSPLVWYLSVSPLVLNSDISGKRGNYHLIINQKPCQCNITYPPFSMLLSFLLQNSG